MSLDTIWNRLPIILSSLALIVSISGFVIVWYQQRALQKHARQIDQCIIVTAAVSQSTRAIEKLKAKRVEQSKDMAQVEDVYGSGKERDTAQNFLESLSDLTASSQVIFDPIVREKLMVIKLESDKLLSDMFSVLFSGVETIDLNPLQKSVSVFTIECMKISDNY